MLQPAARSLEYFNVKSKDESGRVALSVDGNIEIEALNDTQIKQHGTCRITTVARDDSSVFAAFEQSTDTHSFWDKHHNINTDEFKINNGEEPLVLGKKFASFMKDFIVELSRITTETAIGQQPILNSQQVLDYQDKVDELLSSVGFIDK
jgi:hypothetical protein